MIAIKFADGLFITIFSIIIVFVILGLISLSIKSLSFIHEKPKKSNMVPLKQKFTLASIKDEDMMVAALIASIEHQSIENKDVKIISIKEL